MVAQEMFKIVESAYGKVKYLLIVRPGNETSCLDWRQDPARVQEGRGAHHQGAGGGHTAHSGQHQGDDIRDIYILHPALEDNLIVVRIMRLETTRTSSPRTVRRTLCMCWPSSTGWPVLRSSGCCWQHTSCPNTPGSPGPGSRSPPTPGRGSQTGERSFGHL